MPYTVPVIGAPGGPEPAFRADLRTIKTMKDQGWNLFPAATPPAVDRGVVLNGVNQYATLVGSDAKGLSFVGASAVSGYVEFVPTFSADADIRAFIVSTTYTALSGLVAVVHENDVSSNYLMLQIGVHRLLVALANYQDLWRQGERNRVAWVQVSGGDLVCLNGTSMPIIPSGAYIQEPNPDLNIGRYGGGGIYFPGAVSEVCFWRRALSLAEAIHLTVVT